MADDTNRVLGRNRKFNQAGYDCIFLQAPHVLPPLCRSKNENNNDNNAPSTTTSTTNIGRSDARAWFWYNANDPSDIRASQSGEPLVYHGLEASLAIVERELVANQQPQQPQFTPWPFTAILGFSQGAVLGHILAHLAAKGRPLCFANINAVILMSGFAAQHDVCHAQSTHEHSHDTSGLRERMVASITLPSLHVIGRNDSSVAPSASCDLAHAFFVEPQILWHDKGHVIPQQQAHVSTMIDFLNVCEKTTKSMET